MPFSIHPYDAFNICEEGSSVQSWIIEHLFMHEQNDVHVLLNDQGIFLLCFWPLDIEICITCSSLEFFFKMQAPLHAQLLVLQLIFELLLQWSNIWDASALWTFKCSLTGHSTLFIPHTNKLVKMHEIWKKKIPCQLRCPIYPTYK